MPLVTDVYEFEKVIGEGTYSSVVLATHNTNKKKYAVKVIDRSQLDKKEEERVRREIEINKIINHGNIFKVYEVYETEEDICLVMELMSGGELFERIAKKGPLLESECRDAFKGLLMAVNYLHSLGIAHRDLKPENMLFETQNKGASVKIVDFGFAKMEHGGTPLTTPIGTVAYAAPEVLLEEQYSKSVDIWSIGCVLYFMLFGRPPFYSEDDGELEDLATEGIYEFPEKPVVSPQAKDLISCLLEKNPSKRLTASQALTHVWVKGVEKTTDTSQISNENNNNLITTEQEMELVKKLLNKAIDALRVEDDWDIELASAMDSPLWKSKENNQQSKEQKEVKDHD